MTTLFDLHKGTPLFRDVSDGYQYTLSQPIQPYVWYTLSTDYTGGQGLWVDDIYIGYFNNNKITFKTPITITTESNITIKVLDDAAPSLWAKLEAGIDSTILLTFDTNNRFNDAEGDITVAYNQSLGTLAGTRPVESFSVDFTPADLEPTPIDEHTITAGIDITANLIDLEFTEIYADHNVTHTATAGIDLTVTLINIEDINP